VSSSLDHPVMDIHHENRRFLKLQLPGSGVVVDFRTMWVFLRGFVANSSMPIILNHLSSQDQHTKMEQ
jgi:hypothetical protein